MQGRHKTSWTSESDVRTEFFVASRAGKKWRMSDDQMIIGTEDNEVADEALAQQLGRTPGAVRARRHKLKKEGKL